MRSSRSSAGPMLFGAIVVVVIVAGWNYRASWLPKDFSMPSWGSSSPSAKLLSGGGTVCVSGVDGEVFIAQAKAGPDGCAKGLDVAPGRPVAISAGSKQAVVTFKDWGDSQPLPGFAPQSAASPAPGGGGDAAKSASPTPASSGGFWDSVLGGGGIMATAPSWATATCPAGQKTIWIAEDGTVTSDVDGYSGKYELLTGGVFAVKDGTGKLHTGKRLAPGVWCTQ